MRTHLVVHLLICAKKTSNAFACLLPKCFFYIKHWERNVGCILSFCIGELFYCEKKIDNFLDLVAEKEKLPWKQHFCGVCIGTDKIQLHKVQYSWIIWHFSHKVINFGYYFIAYRESISEVLNETRSICYWNSKLFDIEIESIRNWNQKYLKLKLSFNVQIKKIQFRNQ